MNTINWNTVCISQCCQAYHSVKNFDAALAHSLFFRKTKFSKSTEVKT
jgi:hypothetical protein